MNDSLSKWKLSDRRARPPIPLPSIHQFPLARTELSPALRVPMLLLARGAASAARFEIAGGSLTTSVTATLALILPSVSDTVELRSLSLELIGAALTATV